VGGGFYGDLQFESGDFDWSDYSRKVYFAVRRAWLRELYARTARFGRDQTLLDLPDLDGEVVIQFVLVRDGSVQELEIVRPSPMPSLDDASSAALRRAVLPRLPDDFPRDRERVAFLFRLSGFESSHQLQRQLEYSQARGEF
jgi:TonB family protein